jgi:hypothetical protein
MKKNQPFQYSFQVAASRIDELLHAIALAMARRQMQQNWPRR